MWGALIGLGASAIGSTIASQQSAKKAKEAADILDKKEQSAKDSFNYIRGMNEASVNNVLTRNKENMAEQLGYARAVDAMGNKNGAKQLAQGVMQSNAQAAGQAADLVAKANTQAYVTKQNSIDNINNLRYKNLMDQSANIANAGSQVAQAGMGLAQSDLTAHLEKGKGLFESAWGKSGGSSNNGYVRVPDTSGMSPEAKTDYESKLVFGLI